MRGAARASARPPCGHAPHAAVPSRRSAIVAGLFSPSIWCRYVLVAAHGAMALSLWNAKWSTDTNSGASMTAMYMFIWKLFYAEYALLPLIGR